MSSCSPLSKNDPSAVRWNPRDDLFRRRSNFHGAVLRFVVEVSPTNLYIDGGTDKTPIEGGNSTLVSLDEERITGLYKDVAKYMAKSLNFRFNTDI